MTHREALEVLAAERGEHIVITTHGSVDPWVDLSDTPLDFSYVPASMGQGPALGLGLALAQSRHGIVVVTGDGHLLMNLGCLVTIASHPAQLFVIVMDNGVYEVTGGQPSPGSGRTDFNDLARAAGIPRVYFCQSVEVWRGLAGEALRGSGPVLVWLKVQAQAGQRAPKAMRPMSDQIARLQQLLGHERAGGPGANASRDGLTIRTDLKPGDVGTIVHLHGVLYARERGFDASFEAYVAEPLAQFVRSQNPRERLWIAERRGQMAGCVAIVAASPTTAQLRWYLVDPNSRGTGLGKKLLNEAVRFAKCSGYAEVILWTESALAAAAHLYRASGFRKTEEKPGRMWGVDLVEEKFELRFQPHS
jgi:N-acetylglutamate synthase-like GNAT family acetyltransferase